MEIGSSVPNEILGKVGSIVLSQEVIADVFLGFGAVYPRR